MCGGCGVVGVTHTHTHTHALLYTHTHTHNQAYHLYDFWTPSGCKRFLEHDNTHAGGGNRQLLFIFAGANYPEAEEVKIL